MMVGTNRIRNGSIGECILIMEAYMGNIEPPATIRCMSSGRCRCVNSFRAMLQQGYYDETTKNRKKKTKKKKGTDLRKRNIYEEWEGRSTVGNSIREGRDT